RHTLCLTADWRCEPIRCHCHLQLHPLSQRLPWRCVWRHPAIDRCVPVGDSSRPWPVSTGEPHRPCCCKHALYTEGGEQDAYAAGTCWNTNVSYLVPGWQTRGCHADHRRGTHAKRRLPLLSQWEWYSISGGRSGARLATIAGCEESIGHARN